MRRLPTILAMALAMALAMGAELPSFGPREREPRPHTKRDDERVARAEAKRARKAARAAALALLVVLGASGCGASALRQHATIASVSSAALAAAAPMVPAACDAALTACHGSEGCVHPTAERCRIAAASVEVAVASVRGYADAIEAASLADEGDVMPALLVALGGVTRLWAALVAALASLDVELPALPAFASALLGGAS